MTRDDFVKLTVVYFPVTMHQEVPKSRHLREVAGQRQGVSLKLGPHLLHDSFASSSTIFLE